MKTTFYFLRHGEVDNPKKILYGRLPRFSLSGNGKLKIKEVTDQLKDKGIKHIYTSPMLRARQSANIIANELNLKPKISKLLIETNDIHAGIFLKTFKRDIQPHLYEDKYIKIGQESIESQVNRMLKFINMIKNRHKGEKILVVSHGDPILILKAKTSNLEFTWEYKKVNYLPTGGWFKLIYDGENFLWR